MGLRVGVVGTGRLGRAHVRVMRSLPGVDFVACHDTDAARAAGVAGEYGATAYASLDRLLDDVDAVDIVTTTSMTLGSRRINSRGTRQCEVRSGCRLVN